MNLSTKFRQINGRMVAIVGLIGLLALITLTIFPQWWFGDDAQRVDTTDTSMEPALALAILPPLDERLIPFPDEDEAAFDAMQDPDGGPRQAFEWFWRQRAYPLNSVPFDANGRALEQSRAQVRAAGAKMVNWQSMGPAPVENAFMGNDANGEVLVSAAGRVTAIAVVPGDSNTLYVATSTGGLWKSTDGGGNFFAITNDRAEYAFQSLAIDPQNVNTVYAGTGQFNTFYGTGLLKSADAGQTWTVLGKDTFGPLMITGVFVHPGDSNTLVVSTSNLGQLETAGQLPGQVPNPGLYRSTDGGQSWQLVQQCDPCGAGFSAMVMDASNAQSPTFYAANSGVGIYKSVDAGATWQQLGGFDAAVGRVAYQRVALGIGAGVGANTIYAGLAGQARNGQEGIVMKTTDGGQTWQDVAAAQGFCNGQCFHDIAIGVNPQNADIVYFGGVTMFRSDDGGATVNDVATVNGNDVGLHVDHHVIVFDPNDPATVWFGNDGGLYRFANGQWQARNNGMATLQFIGIGVNPIDGSQALGGMQDNSQAYWNGTTWEGFDRADGNKGEWDPFNPNIVYYGDQQISFRVSEQVNVNALRAGGQDRLTGVNQQDNSGFYIPFELDPVRQGVLFLGTDKIYRSTDRAQNWQPISQPLGNTVKSIGIARSDGNRIYAGLSGGEFYAGQQQGGQWNFQDLTGGPLPARVLNDIVVSPTDANVVYIVFNGFSQNTPNEPGHIFKSVNGGRNWARLDGTGGAVIPDVPVLSILLDPDNAGHIYVGTDIGVFHSMDDGQTWANASQGLPPVPVYDLKYIAPVKQLWAATYGRSIWRATLGAPVPNPTPTPTLVPTNTPVNPTDTPVPTNTPQAPTNGARPGMWMGGVDFSIASNQSSIYNLQVFAVSENNCDRVLAAPGPIAIAADGSFTYTFMDRDSSWMVMGTVTGETATGSASVTNISFGTSTCGANLSEEYDWDAQWSESAPDPTPTPMPTATPVPVVAGGIAGQVRANGEGVANINLWLVSCPLDDVCDPEGQAPAAQARTDAGGFYSFDSAPTLPADQFYQVFYLNDESAGNMANDTYLYRWFGPGIESYTAGTAANGGTIEIGELALLTPGDGAVTYPQEFTWGQRAGLTESYVWTLYDPESGEEICRSPAAATASFTLTDAFVGANCPAARPGGNFDWYVWAVDGTDLEVDPAGDSYFTGEVVLAASSPVSQNIYLPVVLSD